MVKGQYYDRRKIENFRKGLYLCYVQMAMKQLLKKGPNFFSLKQIPLCMGLKQLMELPPKGLIPPFHLVGKR